MAVRRRREKARCAVLAHRVRFVRTVCKDVLSCGAIGPRRTGLGVCGAGKATVRAVRADSAGNRAPVRADPLPRHADLPCRAILAVQRRGEETVRAASAINVRRARPVCKDVLSCRAIGPLSTGFGVRGTGKTSVLSRRTCRRAPHRLVHPIDDIAKLSGGAGSASARGRRLSSPVAGGHRRSWTFRSVRSGEAWEGDEGCPVGVALCIGARNTWGVPYGHFVVGHHTTIVYFAYATFAACKPSTLVPTPIADTPSVLNNVG